MFSMFAAVNRRKSLSKISKTVFLSAYDVYLLHCGKHYDEDVYQATKEALKAYQCRIMYYDELLRNAQNLYSDFLEQNKNLSTLSDIINELELG